MTLTSLLLVAALAAPAAQEPSAGATRSDQTVEATRGARLVVENFAGEVVIKAWDRDSVRVQARHGSRRKVNVRSTPAAIVVSADGTPSSVDYEISAPAWMPIKVAGTYVFISIDGAQSEVSAETTQGDVTVKGGAGTVTAKSIMGEVSVEGARGRITASSVNESVRVASSSGDIAAESSNGNITLSQITSENVDVSTINGNVTFDGPPAARGRYRFATHNGNISVGIPESSNVTFIVRTYQGRFTSTLSLTGPPRSEVRQGRRTTYTLGNGSAEMELESFGGAITIGTPGAPRQGPGRQRQEHHFRTPIVRNRTAPRPPDSSNSN